MFFSPVQTLVKNKKFCTQNVPNKKLRILLGNAKVSDVDKTQGVVEEHSMFQGKGLAPVIKEEVLAVVEKNPGQVIRSVAYLQKMEERRRYKSK
ncbi:hypothetical protein JTB14_017492 [Gonioctena quinquepunctata]|nr:hypothetical protein JTB14_017492 [Gonioctena quinquepunctata]